MTDRLCPMLDDDHHKEGHHAPPLPWPVAEAIWPGWVYVHKLEYDRLLFGEGLAERGGFSYRESEVTAEQLERRRREQKAGQ